MNVGGFLRACHKTFRPLVISTMFDVRKSTAFYENGNQTRVFCDQVFSDCLLLCVSHNMSPKASMLPNTYSNSSPHPLAVPYHAKGSDPHETGPDGTVALHVSARKGQSEVCNVIRCVVIVVLAASRCVKASLTALRLRYSRFYFAERRTLGVATVVSLVQKVSKWYEYGEAVCSSTSSVVHRTHYAVVIFRVLLSNHGGARTV